jgi:transcriptional regulator with XRE-family HTH domain
VQDIEHPVSELSIDVGAHLRAVRTMYGLSQRELAKRAGVTNGLISLIEQNRVSPSFSSLKKVLDGIPMSLADFFAIDFSASPQVFFSSDDLPVLGDRSVTYKLVAARRPNRTMAVLHEHYAPGADTGADFDFLKGCRGSAVGKDSH